MLPGSEKPPVWVSPPRMGVWPGCTQTPEGRPEAEGGGAEGSEHGCACGCPRVCVQGPTGPGWGAVPKAWALRWLGEAGAQLGGMTRAVILERVS